MVKRGFQKIKEAKVLLLLLFIMGNTSFSITMIYLFQKFDIMVRVILGFGVGKLKTGCFDFIQYYDLYCHEVTSVLTEL